MAEIPKNFSDGPEIKQAPPNDCRSPPDDCRSPPNDCRSPPDDCRSPPDDCRSPPDDCRSPPDDCRSPPKKRYRCLSNDTANDQNILNTRLLMQCKHGHKFEVQRLLRQGACLETKDKDGNTPLMNCVLNNFYDIAVWLIRRGALVNARNFFRDTPLIVSARNGHTQIAKLLIKQRADINAMNSAGYTPLLAAVEKGHVCIVREILKRRVDFNAENPLTGDTPLISSISQSGSLHLTQLLLECNSVNIEHTNRSGLTALMKAVMACDLDTVHLLLDAGARYDEPSSEYAPTAAQLAKTSGLERAISYLRNDRSNCKIPLGKAFEARDVESFMILLDCHCTDLKKRDGQDSCVLIDVLSSMKLKDEKVGVAELNMITQLLKSGATVDTPSKNKDSPVVVAVELQSKELLELLLAHNAPPDGVTYTQPMPALILAAGKGHCDMMELLLRYGADVNGRFDARGEARNGYSAFDMAIENGQIDSAHLLLIHNAEVDITKAVQISVKQNMLRSFNFLHKHFPVPTVQVARGGGKTGLLHAAVARGNTDMINMLLDWGADIESVFHGKTPLMMALKPDVVKLLLKQGADVNKTVEMHPYEKTAPLNAMARKYISELENINKEVSCDDIHAQTFNKEVSCDDIHAQTFKDLGKIVELFLTYGADHSVQNPDGATLFLVTASVKGAQEVLQKVIEKGAYDIEDVNIARESALHLAARNDALESVKLLVTSCNAAVNLKSKTGMTPLMEAVKHPNCCITEFLVAKGADVNLQDDDGNTALGHALHYDKHSVDTLKILLQAGTDVNLPNKEGCSAVVLAARNQDETALNLLLQQDAAIDEQQKGKALSLTLGGSIITTRAITCAEILLENNASSSQLLPSIIHKVITLGSFTLLKKLISSGVGPANIDSCERRFRQMFWPVSKSVSPLQAALLENRPQIARYLADLWYFTDSDTMLCYKKPVRDYLKKHNHKECLQLLDKIAPQLMSLQTLSFIVISTALGPGPHRNDRADMTPLPTAMKNKLKFS